MLFKCQMSSGCTPFRVPLVYFAALEGITQKGVELPISRAIGKLHQLPHVKEVTGLMFWELRRKELQTMAFPLAPSCRWQVSVEENTTFCSTYTCYRLSTFYVCPQFPYCNILVLHKLPLAPPNKTGDLNGIQLQDKGAGSNRIWKHKYLNISLQ